MAYSAILKPGDYFNNKLWTGTGSSNALTGVGFQPDFTWIKSRDFSENHELYDAVRGVQKRIMSNDTAAEETRSEGLTAFGADGFTVGTSDGVNKSGNTFVGWNWKANGTGSANTDGTINSTSTSVNTTSGFSIITYTGDGNSGATICHGLGVVPKLVLIKKLNGADAWFLTSEDLGWNKYLNLNANSAESGASNNSFTGTAPTTSVFSVGSDSGVNGNGDTYVAYVWAEIKGFCKIGTWTGNGDASGPFIYTGFKPAWLMFKRTNSTASFVIVDNQRLNNFNPQDRLLFPNTDASEDGSGETYNWDFLSNGIKARTTSGSYGNGNGDTYLYMSFAQSPFTANVDGGLPTTAR